MTFFSEPLVAAFHLLNHSTIASDSSAHGVGVTSSSWCVLLFLFSFGSDLNFFDFHTTVSFHNSLHPSPREHADRLVYPINRQTASPTGQSSSQTPGPSRDLDG